MKKILSLILLFLSVQSQAFELRSPIKEGGLTYGKLNPNEKLYLNNQEIKTTKSGFFFFGIPQDSTHIKLILHTNNKEKEISIPVEKQKWQEEYISGLQPEKVSPSNKNIKRIQKENLLIKKARDNFNTKYFPFCFDRPVKNFKRISSPFGARRILNNIKKAGHSGVDYAAEIGTPIYAPADGIVELTHQDMFLSGKTILINHGFGLFSSYSHLNKISIKTGQKIKKGDLIGEIGTTGRSTGPHLHYAITWMGVRLDPEQLVADFSCPLNKK